MKRKVIDKLIKWNANYQGKPVLLTGAKGVGKTYLAYDFAKAFFEEILYLNFEREPYLSQLFCSIEAEEVKRVVFEHFHLNGVTLPDNRLLILDEISFSPEVMKWLLTLQKTDFEAFPRIIAISSNPISEYSLEPLQTIPIYPLQFDEFLLATANDWYIEAIMTHYDSNKSIPEIVHNELLALHQLYMQIGGMPGSISEYLNFSSTLNIPEQHSLQISAYHDYILKSNSESDALKMNQVLDSLALQLMKYNKKFQYKLIRKGTTHAMYKDAIHNLSDRNYVLPCYKASTDLLISSRNMKPNDEILRQEAGTNFKLYLPDTGFLYTKIMEEKYLPSDPSVQKALLENYAAQAFHMKNYPLMFWESESMAKIDFVLPKENELIPVEIHCNDNTRSKSINILKGKCDFPYAVKISSKNFDYSNDIKYVPYYAVFCL